MCLQFTTYSKQKTQTENDSQRRIMNTNGEKKLRGNHPEDITASGTEEQRQEAGLMAIVVVIKINGKNIVLELLDTFSYTQQ